MGLTDTLTFTSLIPGLTQDIPIVESNKIDFEWVKKAKEYYENKGKDESTKTVKCPGIFSLLARGWVQRAYRDIFIETTGDGITLITKSSTGELKNFQQNLIANKIGFHTPRQLAWFKSFPENTLHTLVKIYSPWFVQVPRGYALLLMPIPYSDDNRFTAATGLLRGDNFLNIQLFWHVYKGREVIKKGTPLHQMILIKDCTVDVEIKDAEDYNEFREEVLKPFFEHKGR